MDTHDWSTWVPPKSDAEREERSRAFKRQRRARELAYKKELASFFAEIDDWNAQQS